ncbi:MAG TPA: pirin family protein [Gammaproteobacteria bacterium]|nr:pirin family protein [Gammaproteobacteria bacterium]
MSWRTYNEPECVDEPNPIALEIAARPRDLGAGLEVARLLPALQRRMVGPFIFLDHIGPAQFDPGQGADVRPHPHIGLATVTYLFDGEFLHRDSLGTEQLIEPGAVNWMSAGRGIVHSERTPSASRQHAHGLHGLQSWVALPQAEEDAEPSFQHQARNALPEIDLHGVTMRLIAGSAFGETSSIKTALPLFYLDVNMPSGSHFVLPADYAERALYPMDAPVTIDGVLCQSQSLAVLNPGDAVEIAAHKATRLMILGGEPLDGERYIWWNLVSSSKERIEDAKRDWAERRFPKVPGDDEEFIPLPKYL